MTSFVPMPRRQAAQAPANHGRAGLTFASPFQERAAGPCRSVPRMKPYRVRR